MNNITFIAGARPNFIKMAPILHALNARRREGDTALQYRLVHTGQHYDHRMSGSFFEELNIPLPDVNLQCGGGTQAEQTAAIMLAFEAELMANPTDLVVVVGDVNSTMACTLVAKKLGIDVAHVEAGIRSSDRSMPEEINRMVTDSICDFFFTTTPEAGDNLIRQGIGAEQIFFVGNVMIDTLRANEHRFTPPPIWDTLRLAPGEYLVLTMHRPANVDQVEKLRATLLEIDHNVRGLPVIFPVHPRTREVLDKMELNLQHFHFVEPLGYLAFNYLVKHAKCVMTDSGGITEETTVMGVPCLTMRDNTERPETVTLGTNELIGTDPARIRPALDRVFDGNWKQGRIPELWDGHAAERIVVHLIRLYG